MSTRIEFEDGDLVVTRVYDAPREAVFEAWIETSQVDRWYGCADATAVRSEIEPRVGGKYNQTMTIHGSDIVGEARIVEYDPPALLVFATHVPEGTGDAAGTAMTVRVEFTEREEGTEVRLVHSGIPSDLVEIVRGGWTHSFGQLDTFLATQAQGK